MRLMELIEIREAQVQTAREQCQEKKKRIFLQQIIPLHRIN